MKSILAFAAAGVGLSLGVLLASAAEEKPEYTIKQVMKIANKEGLQKKVAGGQGSKEDAEKLLKVYEALAANKPPKGTEADWKERTESLVKAAKAVVDSKPGAAEQLTKAANCAACHKEHKPG